VSVKLCKFGQGMRLHLAHAASLSNSFFCSWSSIMFRSRLSSSQVSWISAHKARISRKQLSALGRMRTI